MVKSAQCPGGSGLWQLQPGLTRQQGQEGLVLNLHSDILEPGAPEALNGGWGPLLLF